VGRVRRRAFAFHQSARSVVRWIRSASRLRAEQNGQLTLLGNGRLPRLRHPEFRGNSCFGRRGHGVDCRSAAFRDLGFNGSARTTEVCGVRVRSAESAIYDIAREFASRSENLARILQNLHRGFDSRRRLTTTKNCARAPGALQVLLRATPSSIRARKCPTWRGEINKRLTTA